VELIREADALATSAAVVRAEGRTVGLVPTMGALHEGHDALIRRARGSCDQVIVSIFVNPLQFDAADDLARYPRDEAADLERCERLNVDVVWAPSFDAMYPGGAPTVRPDPGPVGATLEGVARPGHFSGVLAAVYRLLEVTGPCAAFFGEKDAQQLFLIRQMVDRLDLPHTVVGCATVREADGLARSSRNAYLSSAERDEAGCLFLGLSEAAGLARAGERDARRIAAAIAREVGAAPTARLEYAAVVDEATFVSIDRLDDGGNARALVAARFPSARLIDNVRLPEPP
jgi:pantoate--beta-alanine ligase